MRIDDDDFRRFGLADAPITTQAEHVLCVAEAVTVAWHGLHGEERKPSFAAYRQSRWWARRRNVLTGCHAPRGRRWPDVPVQGLVVEGFASADLVGVAAEPGGEMVMHDLAPLRLGLQRCAAALPRWRAG